MVLRPIYPHYIIFGPIKRPHLVFLDAPFYVPTLFYPFQLEKDPLD